MLGKLVGDWAPRVGGSAGRTASVTALPMLAVLAGGPAAARLQLRKIFDEGLRALKAECLQLKPYSLRRGGASHHFRSFGDLPAATYRGRWEAAKTAKIYIQECDLELMALAIPPDCAHECSLYITRLKAWL